MKTNWDILGIQPTTDKEALRQAYMTMLPSHNPEDDPEGFLRLRTAYEEILNGLDQSNEPEDTPHTKFLAQITDIYYNFPKRCSLSEWKSLLETPVCQRLDMVDETEAVLLTFLIEHYFLSMDVWAALNAHFDWPSRTDDLKQRYPNDFIGYIVKKATEPEHPRHNLFSTTSQESTDYDQWISLFLELEAMLSADRHEEPYFNEQLSKLEAIPLSHPYYNVLLARIGLNKSEYDHGFSIITPIYTQYPNDQHIRFSYTAFLLYVGNEKEAIAEFTIMLEENPHYLDAKKGILNALIKLEDYEAAYPLMNEILDIHPYDSYTLSTMQPLTEELANLYNEKHLAAPTDANIIITLAEYHAKLKHTKECQELLAMIKDPTVTQTLRYKEIYALTKTLAEEWEESLALFAELVSHTQKSFIYGSIAAALNHLGRGEEALPILDEGIKAQESTDDDELSKNRNKSILYSFKLQTLFALNRYEEAMEAANKSLDLNPADAYIHTHKARLCTHLGLFSDAINSCDIAISIYPFMSEPYLIQMDIFLKESMYDQVLLVAEKARELGHVSPKIKCHTAEALRLLGQYDQAHEIMEILVAAKYNEDYRNAICAEMAQLKEAIGDLVTAAAYINEALQDDPRNYYWETVSANIYRKQKEYTTAIETFDNILAETPTYVSALVGKANVYVDMNEMDTATKLLNQSIEAAQHYEPAYDRIIDILMEASKNEEALDWIKRRLSRFETLPNRIYVAIMHTRLNQPDQAEEVYKIAIDKYPEATNGFRYYGLFLQSNRRFNEAIHQYELSLNIDPSQMDLYESMAYCLQEEKEYQQALEILDTAEENESPYNEGALAMRRATIYEDMLRPKDALTQMLRAANLPDKLDDEWKMSWIYTRIGLVYAKNFNDPKAAMDYFNKAIKEDESCIDAIDYLGDIYLYAYNNYEKAISYYNKKIEKEPSDPHTYATRALAYAKQRKFIRARRDYKKALELYEEKSQKDPSPCWNIYIANCKLGLKEIPEATKMFENGINTPSCPGAWCNKPKCDVCLYNLGKIYEEKKQYEKALDYYNQAIEISNSIKHNAAKNSLLEKMK
ncbi:MAG: tetratricopeptide repeat protein [Defluviitaleaceae bacterium]|nr:tetratricopeptide repeat protein [Defluviitaleaceae bacterium]